MFPRSREAAGWRSRGRGRRRDGVAAVEGGGRVAFPRVEGCVGVGFPRAEGVGAAVNLNLVAFQQLD